MPPPDYGPSAVWPYAVAAAVVLATSLFYFFTRQVTFSVHALCSTPSVGPLAPKSRSQPFF